MKTNTNALISAWYSPDFLNVTLAPFFFAFRVCKKDVQHKKMCTASVLLKRTIHGMKAAPHTHTKSTQKVPSET